MAQENIKGITIQIGGDVQPLNDALSDATKQTAIFEKKLKDLNDKLKLDPKNVELLTQKQSLLSEEVSNTETTLAALNKAYSNMKEAVKKGGVEVSKEEFQALGESIQNTEKHLDETKGRLEDVNRKLKETGKESGKAADGVDDASDGVKKLGENADKAGGSMGNLNGLLSDIAFGVAMGNFLSKIWDGVKKLAEYTRNLDDLLAKQDRLNKSIEDSAKSWRESQDKLETSGYALEIQANRIFELDKKIRDENTTEKDAVRYKEQLKYAVDKFNEAAGESVLVIDEETGALKNNAREVKTYIENLKKRAKAEGAYSRLVELYTEINKLEAQNIGYQHEYNTNEYVNKQLMLQNIGTNEKKIEQMREEAGIMETTIEQYYSYANSQEAAAQKTQELSDAEQARLEAEQIALEEQKKIQQEEARLLDLRLQKTTDTNSKINLDYEKTLEDRAEIMRHNTEVTNNYEQNMQRLFEIALNQTDEDMKNAMLSYIATLTDYSTDSMEIAQMMVDDFSNAGGDMAWGLIDAWNEANLPSETEDLFIKIGKAAAKGITETKDDAEKAAKSTANAILAQWRKISVNFKYTGANSGVGMKIQAMAQGGIVTSPTFSLVGEAGPEAIIPLDRLGGIIESALDGRSSGGQNIMNVYPISMSAQEQDMLLDKFDRRFGDRTARRAI